MTPVLPGIDGAGRNQSGQRDRRIMVMVKGAMEKHGLAPCTSGRYGVASCNSAYLRRAGDGEESGSKDGWLSAVARCNHRDSHLCRAGHDAVAACNHVTYLHRAGQMLQGMEKADSSAGNQHTGRLDRLQLATSPTYAEQGIEKTQARSCKVQPRKDKMLRVGNLQEAYHLHRAGDRKEKHQTMTAEEWPEGRERESISSEKETDGETILGEYPRNARARRGNLQVPSLPHGEGSARGDPAIPWEP